MQDLKQNTALLSPSSEVPRKMSSFLSRFKQTQHRESHRKEKRHSYIDGTVPAFPVWGAALLSIALPNEIQVPWSTSPSARSSEDTDPSAFTFRGDDNPLCQQHEDPHTHGLPSEVHWHCGACLWEHYTTASGSNFITCVNTKLVNN